jgi:hypothetical protein
VSVFYDRQDELEKHEFMMGEARGRLAVTLDVLTDALVLVGSIGCTARARETLRFRPSICRL